MRLLIVSGVALSAGLASSAWSAAPSMNFAAGGAGAGGPVSTGVFLGVGGVAYNMARFGVTATGNKSLLGKTYPELTLGLRVGLGPIAWAPRVGYTLLGKEGLDSSTTKLLIVTSPLSINPVFDFLDFKFGPGVIWYSVDGPEDMPTAKTMPNGTSTAQFVLPDRKVTTRTLVLTAGVGAALGDFRFDLDALMSGAFGSRRALSVMANLSYRLYQ